MFEKFLPWGRFEWLSFLEWIHPKFAYLCTVLNKHILRFPMARLDLLGKIPSLSIYFVGTNRNIAETVYHSLYIKMKIAMSRIFYGHKSCHRNVMRPLCTYQWKSRGGGGGGVRARGRDLTPETIPLSGFWSCEATPRKVWSFHCFNRHNPILYTVI